MRTPLAGPGWRGRRLPGTGAPPSGRGQAAPWHRRAAEWAGVTDVHEGLRHWRRVRELSGRIEDLEQRTALGLEACGRLLSLGWRTSGHEEEADDILRDGRALAEEAGDRRALAVLIGNYSAVCGLNIGSASDYVRYSREALEIARDLGDRELIAGLGTYRAFSHWFSGEPRECLQYCEEVLDHVGEDLALGASVTGYSPCLTTKGMAGAMVKAYLGRFAEAVADAEQTLTLAQRYRWGASSRLVHQSVVEGEIWPHVALAHIAGLRGVGEGARQSAERVVEFGDRFDHLHLRVFGRITFGQVESLEGFPERAILRLEEAEALANEHRYFFQVPFLLARRAEARLEIGDVAGARRDAEAAIERARRSGAPGWEAYALLAHALVLSQMDADAAERGMAMLEEAEHLIHETEFLYLVPKLHEVRGRLARAKGDETGCVNRLREALRLYDAMDASGHAERLRRELAR